MRTWAACLCVALGLAPVVRGDVEGLVRDLRSKDPDQRRTAAIELGKMGAAAKGATDALARSLKDEDPFVRRFAAQALGEIGPAARQAVPALAAALRDRHKGVVSAAAAALGKMGPGGVKALTDLAKDASKPAEARRLAVESLGKIGPDAKDAVPALVEMLQGKGKGKPKRPKQMTDADRVLRLEVVQTLGKIGPEATDAVKPLEEIVANKKERDRSVKQAARVALRQIKGGAK